MSSSSAFAGRGRERMSETGLIGVVAYWAGEEAGVAGTGAVIGLLNGALLAGRADETGRARDRVGDEVGLTFIVVDERV